MKILSKFVIFLLSENTYIRNYVLETLIPVCGVFLKF